jgi:peptidyl-prolyl cis-trans isomerase A (cyclophilin A)
MLNRLPAPACFLLAALLVSCQSQPEESKNKATASTPAPSAESSAKVRLSTNHGDIVLLLDRSKAPATVENFLSYVEKKHYDGTLFHRVMSDFMIQGGGFTLSGSQIIEKPTGNNIRNEGQNGLRNLRGTIAMARTKDPHSARSQFFINVKDNPMLDYPNGGGYAVFGKVIDGMDVVDKIKSVPVRDGVMTMLHPHTGQPVQLDAENIPASPVIIQSAAILPVDP